MNLKLIRAVVIEIQKSVIVAVEIVNKDMMV